MQKESNLTDEVELLIQRFGRLFEDDPFIKSKKDDPAFSSTLVPPLELHHRLFNSVKILKLVEKNLFQVAGDQLLIMMEMIMDFKAYSDTQGDETYFDKLKAKIESSSFLSLIDFHLRKLVVIAEKCLEMQKRATKPKTKKTLFRKQLEIQEDYANELPKLVDDCSPLLLKLCDFIYGQENNLTIAIMKMKLMLNSEKDMTLQVVSSYRAYLQKVEAEKTVSVKEISTIQFENLNSFLTQVECFYYNVNRGKVKPGFKRDNEYVARLQREYIQEQQEKGKSMEKREEPIPKQKAKPNKRGKKPQQQNLPPKVESTSGNDKCIDNALDELKSDLKAPSTSVIHSSNENLNFPKDPIKNVMLIDENKKSTCNETNQPKEADTEPIPREKHLSVEEINRLDTVKITTLLQENSWLSQERERMRREVANLKNQNAHFEDKFQKQNEHFEKEIKKLNDAFQKQSTQNEIAQNKQDTENERLNNKIGCLGRGIKLLLCRKVGKAFLIALKVYYHLPSLEKPEEYEDLIKRLIAAKIKEEHNLFQPRSSKLPIDEAAFRQICGLFLCLIDTGNSLAHLEIDYVDELDSFNLKKEEKVLKTNINEFLKELQTVSENIKYDGFLNKEIIKVFQHFEGSSTGLAHFINRYVKNPNQKFKIVDYINKFVAQK